MRSIIATFVFMFMVACSAIPFEDGRGGSGGGSDGGGGGNKDPNARNHRVRLTIPSTSGTVKFTDRNDGTMPSRSLPIMDQDNVYVDPYGHTRGTEPGLELQIISPNGNEWGCREPGKSACDALMYADGHRVFGRPVSNTWTCDGVKPANCFIPATELDP